MINLIYANDVNGIIGLNNDLPWRQSKDLKHFKEITKGGIVVMGRRTWESLPIKPLPGRTNIVISRDKDYYAGDGVLVTNNINFIRRLGMDNEVFIIGGAAIYELFEPYSKRMYETRLQVAIVGDTYFNPDRTYWEATECSFASADNENDYDMVFLTHIRKKERIE